MKLNPTNLLLIFMVIALLVVAGYLVLTDPFTHQSAVRKQNISQNHPVHQQAITLYLQNCAKCHGAAAEGQNGNPSLQNTSFSESQIQQIIHQGRGEMPAFPQFSQDELTKLSRLIKQF